MIIVSIENIRLKESDYRRLYEEQIDRNNLIESIIKFSAAEQIKRDQELIANLTSERDILKGKVESVDKQIAEIKAAYEQAKRNLERQVREEKERQLTDFKKNVNSKKLKPLEERISLLESELDSKNRELEQVKAEREQLNNKLIECETLLKSRNEEIERLKSIESKVDTIYNYLISSFGELKLMINNGSSKDEIIDTIESIESTAKERVAKSKEELEAEDLEIIQELNSGMTKSEIADKHYSHLSDQQTRRVQLSKRMKSKRFMSLVGKQNND